MLGWVFCDFLQFKMAGSDIFGAAVLYKEVYIRKGAEDWNEIVLNTGMLTDCSRYIMFKSVFWYVKHLRDHLVFETWHTWFM